MSALSYSGKRLMSFAAEAWADGLFLFGSHGV